MPKPRHQAMHDRGRLVEWTSGQYRATASAPALCQLTEQYIHSSSANAAIVFHHNCVTSAPRPPEPFPHTRTPSPNKAMPSLPIPTPPPDTDVSGAAWTCAHVNVQHESELGIGSGCPIPQTWLSSAHTHTPPQKDESNTHPSLTPRLTVSPASGSSSPHVSISFSRKPSTCTRVTRPQGRGGMQLEIQRRVSTQPPRNVGTWHGARRAHDQPGCVWGRCPAPTHLGVAHGHLPHHCGRDVGVRLYRQHSRTGWEHRAWAGTCRVALPL